MAYTPMTDAEKRARMLERRKDRREQRQIVDYKMVEINGRKFMKPKRETLAPRNQTPQQNMFGKCAAAAAGRGAKAFRKTVRSCMMDLSERTGPVPNKNSVVAMWRPKSTRRSRM